MAKNDEKVAAIGCLLMILMAPFTCLLRGFVLTRLWLWFVTPFGLQPIGLAHAYGLSILIALFTASYYYKNEDEDAAYIIFKMGFLGFGTPLFMWFFGWVCYCWM